MDQTTPMKLKPLVNATCKLGKKGCFADGRCHALANCENKITTNADLIRAMSDEELAELLIRQHACSNCDYYGGGGICKAPNGFICTNDYAAAIIQKWLQSEAEEQHE